MSEKMFQNTLDKILILIVVHQSKINRRKGYITQQKFNLFNKNLNITTHVRKNMKRKNTLIKIYLVN